MTATTVQSTNPRTGKALQPIAATSAAEVNALAFRGGQASPQAALISRAERARLLDALAANIESHRDALIAVAANETGFTPTLLDTELTRAAYQFRFFGEVVREGSYLEATIDRAEQTPMGARPDLRRMLIPIGAVAVFGASNFPFAFSVLGGDVASALAGGNPVVVKAHSSHPATSRLSYDVLDDVLEGTGNGELLSIVYGTAAGAALVAHPSIKAVGFTGSLSGGQALMDIIAGRDEPIPFYGELSSLNPVFVTPRAAAERAEEIGQGLIASITVGSGQLCTKPGFALVPLGPDGDRLVAAGRSALADARGHVLLNEGIYSTYVTQTDALDDRTDLAVHRAPRNTDPGYAVTPALVETSLATLDDTLVHEIFGPVTVIARYNPDQLLEAATRVLGAFPASLTATLHVSEHDTSMTAALTTLTTQRAGRIIFNAFPTGVAVSWAQHHGGPWPSTNSLHSSVGATAIRRFLRPVTFQNAPEEVLPAELGESFAEIPRRINGILRDGYR